MMKVEASWVAIDLCIIHFSFDARFSRKAVTQIHSFVTVQWSELYQHTSQWAPDSYRSCYKVSKAISNQPIIIFLTSKCSLIWTKVSQCYISCLLVSTPTTLFSRGLKLVNFEGNPHNQLQDDLNTTSTWHQHFCAVMSRCNSVWRMTFTEPIYQPSKMRNRAIPIIMFIMDPADPMVQCNIVKTQVSLLCAAMPCGTKLFLNDQKEYDTHYNQNYHHYRPAKSHGISVSLQKSALTSRSQGNVKKTHGIRVIWGKYLFSAKKSSFSVASCEMWVSECTLEVFCVRGKEFRVSVREKVCHYPPPLICDGFGDHGKFLLQPPPTESRQLLEITEKTQEIPQAQLGSSVISPIIPMATSQ